jgi:hypothetical protein
VRTAVEFTLDVGADRGIGSQGLQAPRELVPVQVQLARRELHDPVEVAARVTHGLAFRGIPVRQ